MVFRRERARSLGRRRGAGLLASAALACLMFEPSAAIASPTPYANTTEASATWPVYDGGFQPPPPPAGAQMTISSSDTRPGLVHFNGWIYSSCGWKTINEDATLGHGSMPGVDYTGGFYVLPNGANTFYADWGGYSNIAQRNGDIYDPCTGRIETYQLSAFAQASGALTETTTGSLPSNYRVNASRAIRPGDGGAYNIDIFGPTTEAGSHCGYQCTGPVGGIETLFAGYST